MYKKIILINFLLIALLETCVHGGAYLELKMEVYDNSASGDWGGGCCDLFCTSCDHLFLFSIDNSNGRQDGLEGSKVGSIFQRKSGYFQDQNKNVFNADISGVTNPIVQYFEKWPGAVLFKVYVEDDDSGFSGNDKIDAFIQTLTLEPQMSKATARWTPLTMRGLRSKNPSSFFIQYRLYCDSNFYGKQCYEFCLARDSDTAGHYTCDPATGSIVCLPGWKDPATKCVTRINECASNGCRNGATCVSQIGSYTCICAVGFSGAKCEVPTNVQCRNGYVGTACEVKLCDYIFCKNGGTCLDGVCRCQAGYTGVYCEESQTQTCKDRPCENDGTCYDVGYRCDCLADYMGTTCERTRPPTPNATFEHYQGDMEDKEFSISTIFNSKAGGLLIALIVIACVLLLLLIILLVCLCRYRRKAKDAEKDCNMMSHGASASVSKNSERTITDNQYHSNRFTSQSSVFSDVTEADSAPGSRSTGVTALMPATYDRVSGEAPETHYDTLSGSLDAVALEKKKAHIADKAGVDEKAPPPPARPKVQKMTDVRGESMDVDRKASC